MPVRGRPDADRRCVGEASRQQLQTSRTAAVDLYWIPLGAGGHSVRFNGRVFEAIEAARAGIDRDATCTTRRSSSS
jgi:hypothetical protein